MTRWRSGLRSRLQTCLHRFDSDTVLQTIGLWWNGIHSSLKSCRLKRIAGSSPVKLTNMEL